MSETLLTLFVYLFFGLAAVTFVYLNVALIQVLEDVPSIKEKIWRFRSK